MFIAIDLDSKLPIYEQIQNQIIIGISKGQLEADEVLPSVRQLASDLGINLHTVNKAYKELENRGFLKMDRSAGTRVRGDLAKLSLSEETILLDSIKVILAEYNSRGYSHEEITEIIRQSLKEVSYE